LDFDLRFRVVPVERLVESDYTPEKVPTGCMTHGLGIGWRLLRRLGLRCCWYHGGDWREVNRVAARLLAEAQAEGLEDVADVMIFVRAHPAVRVLPMWQRRALNSLFSDPITPPEEGEEFYGNGRHRSRAMRDAGVRHAVVAEWTPVSECGTEAAWQQVQVDEDQDHADQQAATDS
jgi:hypothetical protein